MLAKMIMFFKYYILKIGRFVLVSVLMQSVKYCLDLTRLFDFQNSHRSTILNQTIILEHLP